MNLAILAEEQQPHNIFPTPQQKFNNFSAVGRKYRLASEGNL